MGHMLFRVSTGFWRRLARQAALELLLAGFWQYWMNAKQYLPELFLMRMLPKSQIR